MEDIKGVKTIKVGEKIYQSLAESHFLKKQVDELHNKQPDIPIIETPETSAANSAKELLLIDNLLSENIRVLLSFQSSC